MTHTGTATEDIQAHLESGLTLTPKEAIDLFGCMRLAAIVHRLRGRGLDIETELVPWGGSAYAEYSIREDV